MDPMIANFDVESLVVRGRKTSIELPSFLNGQNLIIAGDSNDRIFTDYICNLFQGYLKVFDSIPMVDDNPWGTSAISYPPESQSRSCHLDHYNASILFLFHMGVYGEEPETQWHQTRSAVRMNSHWPYYGNGTRIHIPLSKLIKYVWPAVVKMHLPTRPIRFLTQSSLWDTLPFQEAGGCFQYDMNQNDCERLFEKDWFERASEFLRAMRGSTLHVDTIMWRTNPHCPLDSTLLSSLHDKQGEDVVKAIRSTAEGSWAGVKIVDWRFHFQVKDHSQCVGIHYHQDGYLGYLQALEQAFIHTQDASSKPHKVI